MKWLADLPQQQQESVIKFAMKKKNKVVKDYTDHKLEVAQKRRDRIIRMHEEKKKAQEKVAKEKEELSKLHLIASVSEFDDIKDLIVPAKRRHLN